MLGRVNPLALEEFEAMEERHRFLAEQLDDLRRTRKDLVDIIADVDARVEQVFAEAYADVEVAFERVFKRLFPGGEGRLVLTEPGDWLTTGIDVEARPAGKKVKRLSLLSGGERSLVAVAFLVSLFIARPSPFYILDEVEAALDDTNLGRLLDIYTELRGQQPAPGHHPPEADDGDRRRALRRDHARRRRLRRHLAAPAGDRSRRLSGAAGSSARRTRDAAAVAPRFPRTRGAGATVRGDPRPRCYRIESKVRRVRGCRAGRSTHDRVRRLGGRGVVRQFLPRNP